MTFLCFVFCRMEETLRSNQQYKAKYEQLRQDKASLTAACEVNIFIWNSLTIQFTYADKKQHIKF